MTGWQFWIDRGGTFTDVIGLAPSGELHIRKVLSVQPGAADGGDPGIRAARNILGATSQETPEGRVDAVKVGTTVATNALLERKGEPVLLVTTVGFADGLRIGYQSRPDLFARHIVLPDRLYPQVIEANERVDAAGMVLTPLDTERLRSDLERARQAGLRSVAIIFLHGWRHQQHERAAAAIAREVGFEEVSVSHELSPLVRYVARGDTTVLNAYLAPPLQRYVGGLQQELRDLDPRGRLELMQSNGGLAAVESFHAVSSVLSGPAGGLIGMGWVGRRLYSDATVGRESTSELLRPSSRPLRAAFERRPGDSRHLRRLRRPFSRWASKRWLTLFGRCRRDRDWTPTISRCFVLEAQQDSTHVASPGRRACGGFSCIRWRVCSPRLGLG